MYLGWCPVVACVSALTTWRGSHRADVHAPRALAQPYHTHIERERKEEWASTDRRPCIKTY